MSERTPQGPEIIETPEQINPKYDALLVHGYWMSEHRTGLALRSRLAARAAALAYDNGNGANKIVVNLGHLWGPDYPTEGKLIAEELEKKYYVPHEAIILRESAYSTGGEVKSFLELAGQNGWTNLLDIAFSSHHLTIPRIYEEYSGTAEFKNIEDLLKANSESPHIENLLGRLARSRYGKAYWLYERTKWLAMHRPGFNYDELEQKNKKARTDKGKDFIVPIDVYKS
ncbi:MAG TPA: hypothetical protein VMR59_02105 [Patescibacteria group bacterium]|jgi:hypothetical protein|nr:hypothetical protein [Patescibacteria group bacterium]